MYEIYSSAGLIWDPRISRGAGTVLTARLSQELNRAGSLTFTLPPLHPAFELLPKLTAECWVLQDGEEIFRGRVLYSDKNIRNCKDMFCEGLLNVLNDECLRPEDLSPDGTYSGTASGLVDKLCFAYNARQTGAVPFVRGTVDNFGIVKCEANDYPRIGEILQKTAETYGGYVFVRRVNGQNMIDYTISSGTAGEQTIRFGENLLDLKEHVTGENVFTVVIPLGKDLGEGVGRLTIKQAADSGGKDYIENAAAISLLGVRIAKVVTFDDIEDPDELYSAGSAVFSHGGGVLTGIELSAVDLCDVGVETSRLRIGNFHRVYSAPNGIDGYMPLTKLDVDPMHPDGAVYTFGLNAMSLTEQQTQAVTAATRTATAANKKASAAATPAQVSAAIAASEGRVGDYVAEIGTSGGWTVRKWSSGLIEAACRVTAEIASGGMTVWGGVYVYSGTKAYPTGLFTAVPELHAAVIGGSMGAWCGMAAPSNNTKDAAAYSLIAPAQTTAAQTCVIALMARGN